MHEECEDLSDSRTTNQSSRLSTRITANLVDKNDKNRAILRRMAGSGAKAAKKSSLDVVTAEIIGRATEVIGDKQLALRWLGTPIRALKYQTPISLIGNAKGQHAVLTVLSKLEHGVL